MDINPYLYMVLSKSLHGIQIPWVDWKCRQKLLRVVALKRIPRTLNLPGWRVTLGVPNSEAPQVAVEMSLSAPTWQ